MKNKDQSKALAQETRLAGADRETVLQTLDKVCQSMAMLARTVDRLKLELETSHGKQQRALQELHVPNRLH
jgi:hypothetical protein